VHVKDAVCPRNHLDDAEYVLPLLEDLRHQTGGVGTGSSGDAILDPEIVALSHRSIQARDVRCVWSSVLSPHPPTLVAGNSFPPPPRTCAPQGDHVHGRAPEGLDIPLHVRPACVVHEWQFQDLLVAPPSLGSLLVWPEAASRCFARWTARRSASARRGISNPSLAMSRGSPRGAIP
jgi:hypothetical protein